MAVTYRKPVDDNVPWDQRLANYAGNKDAGKSEYQRALEVHRGKMANGDIEGANAAKKWSDQVNTAIGGIGDNIVSNRTDQINKTTDTIGQKVNATPFEFKQTQTPFQYNADSDPSYQAALRQAQRNTQTAAGNTSAAMNARGIMDSTITTDRVGQQAQQEYGRVSDTILPQLMQQSYTRYQDQNNNDYTNQLANYNAGQDQLKNLTGYAGTLNDLNQQDGNNQYRDKTYAEAVKSGNWSAYKDAVGMTGNLGTGPKSDWGQLPGQQGDPSFPARQQSEQNTAQYLGEYQGMPTMQKIMQDNTIKNMNADNVRAASAEARAAGNQGLGALFDIWDRTGQAPDGIPGVAAGTSLIGKTNAANSADTYSKYLDNTVAKYDKDKKLINPDDVMNSIELSGLSDYDKYKMYKERGLTWDDPIPTAPGK
jgi:hypothetical protein